MEIKINIDESKFQEVLEKELAAFSQEEIHEIMKGAIKEYLNREEILKDMINKPQTDRWGCSIKDTSVLQKFVNNVDLSDIFEEPKEKIKDIISNDETLKKAAVEILANMFKDRFMSAFTQDYTFLNSLADRVAYTLTQRSNGNQY